MDYEQRGNPMDVVPDLITAKELAVLLKWDVRRVYRLTDQRKIPFYGAEGERKQYCAEDVLAALYRPVGVAATIRPPASARRGQTGYPKVKAVRQGA